MRESIENRMRHEAERLGIEYKGPIRYKRKIVLYGFTDPESESDFSVKPHEDIENKLRRFRRIKDVKESIIDFPKDSLPKEIWDYENDKFILKRDVKDRIIEILKAYPNIDLLEIGGEYHFIGSLCTNQYSDDADLDIHIVLNEESEYATKEFQEEVYMWFKDNQDTINAYIHQYPVEVYVQLNPFQEHMADGVYDIMSDKWIKGPSIVPFTFDPYEEYSDLIDDIAIEAGSADKIIGELKRDVIDYDIIKDVVKQLPSDAKEKLMRRLEAKLEEIEKDIRDLLRLKGKWRDARRLASQPKTLEQALQDVELAKSWRDKNVVFKFLGRYNYLRLISDLAKLVDDDKLQDQEVNVVQRILSV